MPRRRYVTAVAAAVVVAVLAVWYLSSREGAPEGIIEATGQVRGTEVTVSSKVPGRVEEMPLSEGEEVREGELAARISSRELAAALDRSRAQVNSEKGRLGELASSIKAMDESIEQARVGVELARESSFHTIHQARASLERAKSDLKEAESRWDLAKSDFDRYSRLVEEEVIPRKAFEEAETRLRAAEARLEGAKNGVEEARAALEKAEASALEVSLKETEHQRLIREKERLEAAMVTARGRLDAAGARVREIEASFSETEVLAPITGTVMDRLVEAGELVREGTPIATLMDLSDIYVRVFIPEADIGRIRLNDPVRVYSDAFPERHFEARISEVSQEAEFTPKEVHMKEERTKLVFGVKASIENPEGYLKPGMPVDVRIKWMEDVPW